jgi:hypothetical protein
MRTLRRRFQTGIVALGLLALAHAAEARYSGDGEMFGFRVGSTTDPDDMFIGAEALVHVGSALYFNPNVEYIFREGSTDLVLNGDFHIDFLTSGRTFFWVGAGIAGLYTNPDGPAEGGLDAGLNLFTGLGIRAGRAIPYLQPKLVIQDGKNHGMLAFGVRF